MANGMYLRVERQSETILICIAGALIKWFGLPRIFLL